MGLGNGVMPLYRERGNSPNRLSEESVQLLLDSLRALLLGHALGRLLLEESGSAGHDDFLLLWRILDIRRGVAQASPLLHGKELCCVQGIRMRTGASLIGISSSSWSR